MKINILKLIIYISIFVIYISSSSNSNNKNSDVIVNAAELIKSDYSIKNVNILGGQINYLSGNVEFDQDIYRLHSYTCPIFNCSDVPAPACPPCDYTDSNPLGCGVSSCGACTPQTYTCGVLNWKTLTLSQWKSSYLPTLSSETNNDFYNFYADPTKCIGYKISLRIKQGAALFYVAPYSFHPDYDFASRFVFTESAEQIINICPNDYQYINGSYVHAYPYGTIFMAVQTSTTYKVDLIYDIIIEPINYVQQPPKTLPTPCVEAHPGFKCVEDGELYNDYTYPPGGYYSFTFEGCKNITVSNIIIDVDFDMFVSVNDPNVSNTNFHYSSTLAFDDQIIINICTEKDRQNTTLYIFLGFSDLGLAAGNTNFFVSTKGDYVLKKLTDSSVITGTYGLTSSSTLRLDAGNWLRCDNYDRGCELFAPIYPRQVANPLYPIPGIFLKQGLSLSQFTDIAINETDNPPKTNSYQFGLVLSTFFDGSEIDFLSVPKNITLRFLDNILFADGSKPPKDIVIATQQIPQCDFNSFSAVNSKQNEILDEINKITVPQIVQGNRYIYDMMVANDNYYGCRELAQKYMKFNTIYQVVNSTRCPLKDKDMFGTNPCCSLSAMFGNFCAPIPQNISFTQFERIDRENVIEQCSLPDCAESVLLDFASSLVQNQYNPCVSTSRENHNIMDTLAYSFQSCHRNHTRPKYCQTDADCKKFDNQSTCNPRSNECLIDHYVIERNFIDCVFKFVPIEISSLAATNLNTSDASVIQKMFLSDQCGRPENEYSFLVDQYVYQPMDNNYLMHCFSKPRGLDLSANVLFDTCFQGIQTFFWRLYGFTADDCTSNVRCDWMGERGTLDDYSSAELIGNCSINTPSHYCGDCTDPLMNCYVDSTIASQTTCEQNYVCYQKVPGTTTTNQLASMKIDNSKFHQTTNPTDCANYGSCNASCGTTCKGEDACFVLSTPYQDCPTIAGVVGASWYTPTSKYNYCYYNTTLVSQSQCTAGNGTYVTCSSLSEDRCESCGVASPTCTCRVVPTPCPNKAACEAEQIGYCTDRYYFEISINAYPYLLDRCLFNYTFDQEYKNSYPQCLYGSQNDCPLGCFATDYSLFDPSTPGDKCKEAGGNVWKYSKTKEECLSHFGCIGFELSNAYAPSGTRRFNTKSERECKLAGEKWVNKFDWLPGTWSPSVPVQLKWTNASSKATVLADYKPRFSFINFMYEFIRASNQRLSEIYRSELFCLISNTKDTLESISCSCAGGGGGSCFPQQAAPTNLIIKPCGESYYETEQNGSISFGNDSVTPNRCVSIGLGTIYQNEFLAKKVQALSSNFISVLKPDDFSVFNEDNGVIGRVIGDGITLNIFSEGVRSFDLCLYTSKTSSSKYPIIDFALELENGDGVVKPLECNIYVNGSNFCCQINETYVGSSSYLLISRVADWKSEKEKIFTESGEGLVYTLAVFYIIIAAVCLVELCFFGYIRVFAKEPFRIVHILFLFLFLFTLTRSIYFFILPTGTLSNGTNVGEYILVVLPTFLYFTSFTIVLVIWYILANIQASLAANLTTLINRMVIVINVVLYILFIIIVLVFNFNHPKHPETCGGRLAGKYSNTKVQSGVSILYAVVQCVLSLAIAMGFIYYGRRVYNKLSEIESKSTTGGHQKRKTLIMATICSIGFLVHCIFIIILVSATPSNIIFSFILLFLTEIVPVVTLIIAYNQMPLKRTPSGNSVVHMTKSTWSSKSDKLGTETSTTSSSPSRK